MKPLSPLEHSVGSNETLDLEYRKANLARSNEHIRLADSRIAKQKRRIAQLEKAGRDARSEKEMLVQFERMFRAMMEHRDLEAAEVEKRERNGL